MGPARTALQGLPPPTTTTTTRNWKNWPQHYGDLVEFWLDGAGSAGHVYDFKKIIETLRTYQPNTVVFADTGLFEYGDARWVGTEAGIVDYENWNVIDRHGYRRWRPVEADTPLRKVHWFWHPNDEASLKSLDELLDIYDKTVGRGAQLMLGLAPDRRGLLPDSDVARLEEFGAALRKRAADNLCSPAHAATTPEIAAALDGDPDTFWSAPAGSHHAVLEVNFDQPVTFDHALTMEWLNDGQHVREIRDRSVERFASTSGKRVAGGEAIGHEEDRPVSAGDRAASAAEYSFQHSGGAHSGVSAVRLGRLNSDKCPEGKA